MGFHRCEQLPLGSKPRQKKNVTLTARPFFLNRVQQWNIKHDHIGYVQMYVYMYIYIYIYTYTYIHIYIYIYQCQVMLNKPHPSARRSNIDFNFLISWFPPLINDPKNEHRFQCSFNWFWIDFNLLSSHFQLVSIWFQFTSIYFQLIVNWFQFGGCPLWAIQTDVFLQRI